MPDLSSLVGTLSQFGGDEDLDELFRQISDRATNLENDATAAGTRLQRARDLPMPQTSPVADALVHSIGNAASLFTGEKGPKEHAQGLIDLEQKMLLQKRSETLASLESAYERAADRAARLGDTETELKLRAKMEKAQQNRSMLLNMMHATITGKQTEEREVKLENLRAGHEAQLRQGLQESELNWRGQQEDLNRHQDERNHFISQGINPDTMKPLPAGGGKYSGRLGKTSMWLTDAQWTDKLQKIMAGTKTTGFGKNIKYDTGKIRNRILNELAPAAMFVNDPRGLFNRLAYMSDPNDKAGIRPLFPRDKKDPSLLDPTWEKRLIKYVQQYYPDWVPQAEATQ